MFSLSKTKVNANTISPFNILWICSYISCHSTNFTNIKDIKKINVEPMISPHSPMSAAESPCATCWTWSSCGRNAG